MPPRRVNLRTEQEAAGDTSAELSCSQRYQWCMELWSQGERKDKGNEGERKGEARTCGGERRREGARTEMEDYFIVFSTERAVARFQVMELLLTAHQESVGPPLHCPERMQWIQIQF